MSAWVWAWTKAYLQEIKVWGKLKSRDHLESISRNRSSVRNASVCLVADDWDGSSGFHPDLQFESLLADQTPNTDLESDTDNEPENSASLLGTDQSSERDNEALISLQESYIFEEVSDEVLDPKLCQIVNTMLTSKISKDKLKDKLENYKRPKNCDILSTTKVNPEIWRQMSSGSRSFDLGIQRVQQSLIKGLMSIIDCFQTLLKAKSNLKNANKQSPVSDETVNLMTSLLEDSLTLISNTNFELIKPGLHRNFMPLCSSAPSQLSCLGMI